MSYIPSATSDGILIINRFSRLFDPYSNTRGFLIFLVMMMRKKNIIIFLIDQIVVHFFRHQDRKDMKKTITQVCVCDWESGWVCFIQSLNGCAWHIEHGAMFEKKINSETHNTLVRYAILFPLPTWCLFALYSSYCKLRNHIHLLAHHI